MWGFARRVLQKLDMDAEYEGHVEAAVSCKSSTWMINMRAMLRPQGNDAEYEGNVETSGEDYSAKSTDIIGEIAGHLFSLRLVIPL